RTRAPAPSVAAGVGTPAVVWTFGVDEPPQPASRATRRTRAAYRTRKRLRTSGLVQLRIDAARRLRRDSRHALELLLRCCQHPLGGTEVQQQRASARRPDALELVEHRRAR